MAIGIRSNSVYFLHQPPTPGQVLMELQDLTGLCIGVAAQQEDYRQLFHPVKPGRCIDVGWSRDRLGNIQRIRAAVPGLSEPPFPNHPYCVELLLDVRSSLRSYRYLEVSLLLVLQSFGGQVAKVSPLADWAGKKWAEMPPLGIWGAITENLK